MSDRPDPVPSGLHSVRRQDHEPPPVTEALGWRYHHVGIPTTHAHEDETYLEQYGLYKSGSLAPWFAIGGRSFRHDRPRRCAGGAHLVQETITFGRAG